MASAFAGWLLFILGILKIAATILVLALAIGVLIWVLRRFRGPKRHDRPPFGDVVLTAALGHT